MEACFLVCCNEGILPYYKQELGVVKRDSELRLFYVAITRAKKTCNLSYATSRFQWGNLITCEPSRFIDEIDPQFMKHISPPRGMGRSLVTGRGEKEPFTGGLNRPMGSRSLKPINSVASSSGKSNSPAGAPSHLKVGYNVEHDRFGKGKVTQLEGTGSDTKATIFFPRHGSKTVLLRFAKLKVLDL